MNSLSADHTLYGPTVMTGKVLPPTVSQGDAYHTANDKQVASDGSTASYYVLPPGATELQDLISHRDMNAQMGEIFRAVYRFGQASHSPKLRDIKKIIFYAQAELARLEKLNASPSTEKGARTPAA